MPNEMDLSLTAESSTIWTFQDAVEHLLDIFDLDRNNESNVRQARRAVLRAYRELYHKRRWTYGHRRLMITTAASFNTGTLTYTASNRTATFTSAIPADARHRMLKINRIHYDIVERVDANNLKLSTDSSPDSDLAAGTTFELYRDSFPIPSQVVKLQTLTDITSSSRELAYVTPDEFTFLTRGLASTSQPTFYTFARDENDPSGYSIRFGHAPNSQRTYEASAIVEGRPLRIDKHANTCSVVTATDPLVVNFGSSLPEQVRSGSVIRISSTSAEPTGPVGSIRDSSGDDSYNLPLYERYVSERTNSTSIKVTEAIPADVTTVGCVISDPIDVEEGAMQTVFELYAEAYFSSFIRTSGDDRFKRMGDAKMALRDAAGYDNRTHNINEMSSATSNRLRDIATTIDMSY